MTDLHEKLVGIIIREVLTTRNKDGMGAQNAADAILTDLPSMVKPLEWEYDAGWHDSGGYAIQGKMQEDAVMWSFRGRYCKTVYPSIKAAKAAAQSHHVAQIMAAFGLEPTHD